MNSVPMLEMAKYDQWLVWTFRDGRKIPLDRHGNTSGVDRTDDYMSFEEAMEASEKLRVQGPAFVFTRDDPFLGIDLDNSLEPDQYRVIKPWAKQICDSVQGYTEASPSLTGLKIFCKGELPDEVRNRFAYHDGEVEVYSHGRFFTVTGMDVYGYPPVNVEFNAVPMINAIAPARPEPRNIIHVPMAGGGDLVERVRSYLSSITLVPGSRNNTIFSAAGSIRAIVDHNGRSLPDDQLISLLIEWNAMSANSVSNHEVEHAANSAFRNGTPRELKYPGTIEVEDFSDIDASAIWAEPVDHDPVPVDEPCAEIPGFPDIKIPGLVGDIARFITESALYPQPELALGAAFAIVSALTGRKLKTTTGMRGNIYVLGLAPSGSGKSHPLSMIGEILHESGAGERHGPASIGSHAGLISWMVKEPCSLFGLDEVGHLFSAIKSAKGGNSTFLSMISKVLLELYSAAGAKDYRPSCYADAERNQSVSHPYLSLMGMSTPGTFFDGFNRESLSDGLLARMWILEGHYVDSKDDYEESEVPADIVRRCRSWSAYEAENDIGMVREKVVSFTEDANIRINGHRRAIESKRKTEDKDVAAIWSRASERAVKFAMLIAAGRHTPAQDFRIDINDVNAGIALANHGARYLIGKADEVGASAFEQQQNEMLAFIGESREGRTLTQIAQRFRGLRSRDRKEVLGALQEQGRVAMDTVTTCGRPSVRFLTLQ